MSISIPISSPLAVAARLLAVLATAGPALGQSTISSTQKHASSANAGWLNLRPSAAEGVVVGEHFLSGYAYAANFGWIHFGDGSPANGHRYSNGTSTDYGVNHDGAGKLSGFAYGANVGWINFGWAPAADPDRPQIDLDTGAFLGFAYGANIGWINLGTGTLVTESLDCPDTDGDSIPDPWEREHFRGLASANATSDRDGDGVTDAQEAVADTDPNDASDYLRIVDYEKRPAGSRFDPKVAMRLTFTSQPSRRYRIHYGSDLINSTADATLGIIIPEEGETTTAQSIVDPADRRFFHVEAERPLKSTTSPR